MIPSSRRHFPDPTRMCLGLVRVDVTHVTPYLERMRRDDSVRVLCVRTCEGAPPAVAHTTLA